MGKKKTPSPANQKLDETYRQAQSAYTQTQNPSQTENELVPISQNFMNNYNNSVAQDAADKGNIMGQFQSMFNAPRPTFERVQAKQPEELNESYGYLREAMPGYREFAQTGGYSPTDVQELRARGISPIRSAYGNTMMELDRARALGGSSGSPNYIAAASKAQRELPGQMADAETTVNAGLADAIRQGRQFGLQGISSTGSTMGGLSSQEANRMLQADTANQAADIQTQQMESQNKFGSLQGMSGLYGATPGMSNMFGQQALSAYGQRGNLENARTQQGLAAIDAQLRAAGSSLEAEKAKGSALWKKILAAAATGAAVYFTAGAAAPAAGGMYAGLAGMAAGSSKFANDIA